MKRKINNQNKMEINRFKTCRGLLTPFKNELFWSKIEKVFNSKKSFLVTLKSFNKSHGVAYKFFYNKETDLYGNNFENQETKRKSAFLAFTRILNEKEFNFLLFKKKGDISDFQRMITRMNFKHY